MPQTVILHGVMLTRDENYFTEQKLINIAGIIEQNQQINAIGIEI